MIYSQIWLSLDAFSVDTILEIETLELKFLLCIMPLLQCLKTCLTLLVGLVGIPAMKKHDIHKYIQEKKIRI